MVKRVYTETVKKWAKATGITGVTLIGLIFSYLIAIGSISNVSYSGDVVCLGTELDPCYAYINFTANEDIFIYPTGYDPWGRDTLFNFDPAVKSWKLERSWGKGWREIPLNETCKGTWCGGKYGATNNAYSYAFRDGRDYQIRITGYKHNPKDSIKWGAFSGVDEIDPIWMGIEYDERGPGFDKVCNGNTCNLVLYSGVRNVYEDNIWKRVEDARSLKNKGFSIVYLKDDETHKIEVVDFNYSFIELSFSYDKNNLTEYEYEIEDGKMKTKFKVIETFYNETTGKPYDIETEQEIEIEENMSNSIIYYGNPLGNKFKLGENSTIIKLQDNETENLLDNYAREESPTINFGTDTFIRTNTQGGFDNYIYIYFNLTSLPNNSIINNASLNMYYFNDILSDPDPQDIYHVLEMKSDSDGGSLNETNMTWNNQPCGISFDNSTYCNLTIESTSEDLVSGSYKWINWTTTQGVDRSYTDNSDFVGFVIRSQGYGEAHYSSKENSSISFRPYLNITYQTTDETNPTYSNNQVNNTVPGYSTLFSLDIEDDFALDPNGQYIFSTNNTGIWVNDSAVNFTNRFFQSINSTENLNDTGGLSIGYRWYLTDNVGNSTITSIFTLTTNSLPTLDLQELYPVSPYSTSDITLNITCSDDDSGDTLTVYWDFYKDGSIQASLSGSQVVSNGTETEVYTILSGNTSAGEQWIGEVLCNDGTINTSKLNTTTRTIQTIYPQWSNNQTNNTDVSLSTLFSVYWTTDTVSLSSYIFGWFNGANWTQSSNSGDKESGTQSISGESAGAGYLIFDDFEAGDGNWTDVITDDEDWTRDSLGTPSSNTGPQPQGSAEGADGTVWYQFVETSTAECNTAGEEAVFLLNQEIDFDAGSNDKINWSNSMYGANIGTLRLQENTTGSWVTQWEMSGDQGSSPVWFQNETDLSSLTGMGWLRFNYTCAGGFTGDVAIDQINIFAGAGSDDNDINKTAVIYSDVISNLYEKLDNITVIVNVSYYNTTGSIVNANSNATLWLEVYNGTDWIDEGNFGVGTTQATQNYSIVVTTASVLTGWQTEANRDIRISARLIDYNSSSLFDTINWTDVWVEVFNEQEFLNDSAVAFTGTQNWSNITKTLTSTIGATIKWYVWANSSDGVSNQTDTFEFITTGVAVDTCTCPGAGNNWEVDMEDNCNLTTVCTLTTGNLTWIGASGYFNCSAQLNLTNRDAPPSSTTFYHSSECDLIRLVIFIFIIPKMFKRKRFKI